MNRLIGALALALTALLTVAGCGSSSSSDFDQADVTFAQQMIPHHQQAVQMSGIAATNASSPRVKSLAKKIQGAQGPEIATMKGWLKDWNESEGSMKDHSGMAGMMSTGEMDALEKARGAAFDTMFLTMMIAHHRGAIDMAKSELEDGQSTEAKALARNIVKAQTSEITEMKAILGS